MIRQVVDKSRYNIPAFTNARLHEVIWYATEDDAVLGVVILDMVDLGYSWIALTQSDQSPGYTAADMGSSLPTKEDATAALRQSPATHSPAQRCRDRSPAAAEAA